MATLYKFTMSDAGVIPEDWFAAQVDQADRTDGDIDTLSNRIAHIRTWTFVSNRREWLKDPDHWQNKTREIEDKLSDALHEQLTQRFVDKRTSVLMKSMRDKDSLFAEIEKDGRVVVEKHFVGKLEGFSFTADAAAAGVHGKAARNAAAKVLVHELAARADRLAAAPDTAFTLTREGQLIWEHQEIGRISAGDDPLKPNFTLFSDEHLAAIDKDNITKRIETWLSHHIEVRLKPLQEISTAEEIAGLARGIAFRLRESFGVLRRDIVAEEIKSVDQEGRAQLRKYGVRFGAHHIYFPLLLKPASADLLLLLWLLKHGAEHNLTTAAISEAPRQGLTSVPRNAAMPDAFYRAAGFHVCGQRAVRVDMLERLADIIRPLTAWKPTEAATEPPAGAAGGGAFKIRPEMMSIMGCSGDELGLILESLGFRREKRPVKKATPVAAPVEASAAETPAAEAASEEAPSMEAPNGAQAANDNIAQPMEESAPEVPSAHIAPPASGEVNAEAAPAEAEGAQRRKRKRWARLEYRSRSARAPADAEAALRPKPRRAKAPNPNSRKSGASAGRSPISSAPKMRAPDGRITGVRKGLATGGNAATGRARTASVRRARAPMRRSHSRSSKTAKRIKLKPAIASSGMAAARTVIADGSISAPAPSAKAGLRSSKERSNMTLAPRPRRMAHSRIQAAPLSSRRADRNSNSAPSAITSRAAVAAVTPVRPANRTKGPSPQPPRRRDPPLRSTRIRLSPLSAGSRSRWKSKSRTRPFDTQSSWLRRGSRTAKQCSGPCMNPPGEQRLDKWLWYARIVKSRSIAAKLIEAGCIRVNRQRVVKASATVKCGDVLTATLHGCVHVIEIRGLGERGGRQARRKRFTPSCFRPPRPRLSRKAPESRLRHPLLSLPCALQAAKRCCAERTRLHRSEVPSRPSYRSRIRRKRRIPG